MELNDILNKSVEKLKLESNANLIKFANALADYDEELKKNLSKKIKILTQSINEDTNSLGIQKTKESINQLCNKVESQSVLIEKKWMECLNILKSRVK